MALTKSSFLKGRDGSKNGLAGYLAGHLRGWGTATVLSGQTTIAVADTDIAASDLILVTRGASTNPVYIIGVTISAATSFTITVSGDPGSAGAVCNYLIIRP